MTVGAPAGLPISSGEAVQVPPPLSLRTDVVGIFSVLMLSGIAQLLAATPDSLQAIVPETLRSIWSWTLLVFGGIGLAATLAPGRWRIMAMGVEAVARLALGLAALAYALAVLEYVGLQTGSLVFLTFLGISVLMMVGAIQLFRWLRRQRTVVTIVMHRQEVDRQDDEDRQDRQGDIPEGGIT